MTNETKITRTCLSCGIEKPISAFLQLTGAKGTTYGNICSSCRTANAAGQNHFATEEPEEETTTSSGLKIDAKTKVYTVQENKKLAQKNIALSLEEKKLETELKEKALETKQTTEFDKNQRDKFSLEKKKVNLFTNKSSGDFSQRQQQSKISINAAIQSSEQQTKTQQNTDTKIQQDKTDETTFTKKGQDNSATWTAAKTIQQQKTATSIFNAFNKRQRDTFNTKLLDRKFHENKSKVAKTNLLAEKKPAKENKDSLVTQAEKNWGPNSTRKR